MYIGIDIEQFVRDPYGSGIQRVLQQLALEWPADNAQADFVVPLADGAHGLLSPAQAADLLSLPFAPSVDGKDIRERVRAQIDEVSPTRVLPGDLLAIYDAWLLPEVSYLPNVLRRLELFGRCVPTAMIGYDTLPMTEPANYRFPPGAASWVSEYFRALATADSVVCISAFARDTILDELRRDRTLVTTVAHPGGDHLPVRDSASLNHPVFTRLGTLEARKRPVEIAEAFREASAGSQAELVFIGGANASDESVNVRLREEMAQGGVRWIEGAGDEQVRDLVHGSSAFLSVGVEGYGIPVLEAIRLGTPVVFDGIQPAAELMVGKGARRMPALSHADLVQTFHGLIEGQALTDLRADVSPGAVPTWRDFARRVAEAVTQA